MSGLTISGVFKTSLTCFRLVKCACFPGFVPVYCCRFIGKTQSRLCPRPVSYQRPYGTNRQMPKKEKVVKGRPAGGAVAEAEASGPVTRDKNGAVTITVHAKPGSKHSSITEVSAEAVGVAIAAPPTDGEANTELIRYLAEVLDLKKSHVVLDKGSRSRDKLIRLDSALSPEEVLRRLRQAAG
ncbi:UPF0235 protein C15orf40 homolog [Sphaeramia orbicularis]|uniref:Uncharacterized protein n=1 Tax=Sphaeramia orbicularis TaxID=375764 RepID=A0A672YKA0_9TELE|nr:UPF0235 protein C15orf40 homolog [Sphaeramia orbicularis]